MTLTKEFVRTLAAIALTLIAGFVLMGNQRQALALPLGSQIVCLVYSDLNNIGAPIPHLNADECPGSPPVSEAGTLRVMKITAGGGAASSDFSIHIMKGGTDVAGSPQPGSPAGTTYIGLTPGAYTVSESGGPANFTLVMSGDCDSSGNVDVASSTLKVCTMTNTYNAPPTPTTGALKVVKIVAGGTATAADFSIHVKQSGTDIAGSPQAGSIVGTTYSSLNAGAYVVSETGGPANYTGAMAGDCDASGNVNVASSTTAVCTITNTFTGGGASTTADVSLTKTVDNTVPNPGVEITFTLTAHNSGPAAATGTAVTDILPAGLTYVSDDGAGSYATSTGLWTIGTLANAVSKLLHIIASVDFGTAGQVITNTASIVANNPDSSTANNSASVSITSTAPSGGGGEGTTTADVSLTKTVDNAAPNPGGTIIYTLTATNSGPNSAASTTVTDVLPSGLTYVSDDGAGAYASTTGVWSVGALASGANKVLHISATVTATAGQVVTNTASIISSNPDSNTGNNTASSSITSTAPNTDGGGTTPTTNNGGGGNGPIAGSLGGGGGGGNGPPVAAPGSVLGASTAACDQYLTAFIKVGNNNDAEQVRRLQTVLHDYEGAPVVVNGVYDAATLAAVHAFQTKYAGDILTPWGVKKSTGFVYLETRKKVNEIYCHFVMHFPLTPVQQAEVDAYRAHVLGTVPPTPLTGPTSRTQVAPKPTSSTGAGDATTTQGDAEAGAAGLPVTNNIISNISDFFGRLIRGR